MPEGKQNPENALTHSPPLDPPPSPSPSPPTAMEEVFSIDDIEAMSLPMRLLTQSVYTALPPPRADIGPPRLYCGPAADDVDRISRLPESILRNVVSRLPVKEAARTVVLSSRWRRIWYSVPIVFVDADLLPPSRTAGAAEIAAAVSDALNCHPGPFRCVHLTATPMHDHREQIAGWLHLLGSKGVSELCLVNNPKKMCLDLPLPTTIFECRNLTVLYLGCWKFPDTVTLPRGAWFPCLKELGLCCVSFIKDEDFGRLLGRCPSVVKLSIVYNVLSPMCIWVRHEKLQCIEICTGVTPAIYLHAPCLDRLMLWHPFGTEAMPVSINISFAPRLRIVGFLEPLMHDLRIQGTDIMV